MTARNGPSWYRALNDCGALRIPFDDDAIFAMIDADYIAFRPVPDNEDAIDVWLTDAGKKRASLKLGPRCQRHRNMAEVMADEERLREERRAFYERERKSWRRG